MKDKKKFRMNEENSKQRRIWNRFQARLQLRWLIIDDVTWNLKEIRIFKVRKKMEFDHFFRKKTYIVVALIGKLLYILLLVLVVANASGYWIFSSKFPQDLSSKEKLEKKWVHAYLVVEATIGKYGLKQLKFLLTFCCFEWVSVCD